jgi:putative phosphoesterase
MPPARRHGYATLTLTAASFRVAVVADTHSRPHPQLDQRLRALSPDHILHAGDIGNREVIAALAAHAPVTVVRGNIDARAADLPDSVTLDVRAGTETLLKILLIHIAAHGVGLRADVRRLAQREDASMVICGHSHVPLAARDRGLTIFNPGSVGPRRFHLPIVLGLMLVSQGGVSLTHVDCETGLPWHPDETPRRSHA